MHYDSQDHNLWQPFTVVIAPTTTIGQNHHIYGRSQKLQNNFIPFIYLLYTPHKAIYGAEANGPSPPGISCDLLAAAHE